MTDLNELYKQIGLGQRKSIVTDYCVDPWETLQKLVEIYATKKNSGQWYPYGRTGFAHDVSEILITDILQNAIDAESQPIVDDSPAPLDDSAEDEAWREMQNRLDQGDVA